MTKFWRSQLGVRVLAEAGVMVALAFVLSFIKVWQMPQGGSVTAGAMAPLILLAIRRGPVVGVVAGVVYGLLDYIREPYFLTPVQFLLDYPVPYGLLGLAGLIPGQPVLAALFGIFLRFVSHVVSGVAFFASYAPAGESPWVYSVVYNGSYLLPDFVICAVILQILALRGLGSFASRQPAEPAKG